MDATTNRWRAVIPVTLLVAAVVTTWSGVVHAGPPGPAASGPTTTTSTLPCNGSVSSGGSAAETTTSTSSTTSTTAKGGGRCPPEDTNSADQPKVRLGPNATYVHQYGSIAGTDPATEQVGDYDPASCRQVQEIPCNVIPIDFAVPAGLRKADTYLARITITWANDSTACNVPVQGCVEGEQLDPFLWPNPNPAANPPPALERDETGDDPKVMNIDLTTGLYYQLVIAHPSGAGNPGGYKLRIDTSYLPFTGVAIGGPPPTSPSPAASAPGAAPVPPSALASPPAPANGSATPVPESGAVEPRLSPPDPSLLGLSGSGVDSAIATNGGLFKPAASVKPPKPVSGATVLLALGIVPLLLVALAGAFLRRFRPVELTLREVTPDS